MAPLTPTVLSPPALSGGEFIFVWVLFLADFIKVASVQAALGDTETPQVTHFG